ncbi:efflux RND transporter periplasmic adaptor subunit [Maridesulfovibrio ferrireducens]|uniref:efflux RND transporter periplasmic adaptor subunit n=1 Tax=Maridesulfovibrio ferrireducens TaxID=246191 RepID=UPI001A35C847|nr:efflux RND transporter periplasmic adaptor subunit [Maridesulfovibrio ferrireducens]MBI9111184.1 efflux RND transporter periplasmic adaptor subunit [Maridesulfovibrio ferrireducens]
MKIKHSCIDFFLSFLLVVLLGLTTPTTVGASSPEVFEAIPAARVISLTGFTRPRVEMTLVSEESAMCINVHADIGDTIGADGLFADLDPKFIKLEIAQLKADTERLQSDVHYYHKEAERYIKLVKKNTAAQSELDLHIRNLKSAESLLRSLQLKLNVDQEHLRRYTLRAPVGWKVVKRYIEPGEWVTKGEKVAELGNFKVLLVPYALTVKELEKINKMEGKVTLDLPDIDKSVEAKLERISPDFDPETRKIDVDFEISSGDFKFRGGLRTELKIEMPDQGGSVIAPESAIVKAYDDRFLVRPDGVRVKVLVLGKTKDGKVRVSSRAVKAGEQFLLKP